MQLRSELLERHRFRPVEAVYWLALVMIVFVFSHYLAIATTVVVMCLFALSLDLVLGFAGIVTLGHAAYFGIGAYAASLLALGGLHEAISGATLAGLGAAVVALLLGPFLLLLEGLPLIMVTMAIGAILYEAANKAIWLTGGDDGLRGFDFAPLLGLFRWSIYGYTAYLYALAWLFVMFLLTRRVVGSPFGVALQGIRENRARMRLIGSPVVGHLVRAYVLSAFMAGIAGAVYAQTNQFVSLEVLSIDTSVDVVVMLVLGGIGQLVRGPDRRAGLRPGQAFRGAMEPLQLDVHHRRAADCRGPLRARRLARNPPRGLGAAHRPVAQGNGRTRVSAFALETSGLCKSFGALKVTDNVSLRLAPGARHALIGPNGAGKTTFVQLLSGVLSPDAGRVSLMGTDITFSSQRHRVKQGLVRTFQVTSLFRGLTVLENVFLAVSEHRGASSQMIRAAGAHRDLVTRTETIVEQLGLADDMHRKIAEIAYGRQRLVEIAVALSLEPKVLLLDEPAAGIPTKEVSLLLDAVERLPSDIAILMIEHDMHVVRRFAAEVTVLVNGAVLLSGSPRDVMSSEEVRTVYLGQSGHERFSTGDGDA